MESFSDPGTLNNQDDSMESIIPFLFGDSSWSQVPPTFGTLMYGFGGKMMKQFKVYFFSLAHAKPPGIGKTLPKN